MPHEQLAREIFVGLGKDLGDGILAKRLVAEHILLARLGIEMDRRYARPLLTAVMLLLHHQIELAHSPLVAAVFLFII